jgi:amino acid transporter
MATAVVEERQLLKTLRWWDGFTIALCNPGFLIGALGYSIGALGAGGALLLWGISAAIGVAQAWIYSEPASMFPEKSGGISLYAHEGWRRYSTFVGPVATFGYWIGWSVVLSIFGKVIGDLVTAQWFSDSTPWFDIGNVHFGLPHLIAIVVIFAVWLFNVFGLKPMVWLTYVCGALLMIPLLVFILLPYLTGDWHSSNVHVSIGGPWGGLKLALVYLFLNAWSAYGTEVCATFTPEYKSRRDAVIALRSAAMFSLLVFTLLPLGLGGVTGANIPAAAAEGQFYVSAFNTVVGSGISDVVMLMVIASLVLSMASSTADAGRALYGISKSGMTIKQLGVLNRFHVPARAMTVDLAVNVLLVLFISSNLAILYMSNIGYVLAHVLALSGFLLLRRDRPDWPRPVKVATGWVGLAAILCVLNAVFLIVGAGAPKLNGYGNWTDFWIGVGILAGSILLFVFRRVVQDKESVHFREDTPTMPVDGDGLTTVAARTPAGIA